MSRLAATTLAGLVVLSAGLVVRGQPTDVSAGASLADFWTATHITSIELEQFETIDELSRSADAVVVGRITDVREGRIFGEPLEYGSHPEERQHFYATVDVAIEQIIAGAIPEQQWMLEILMPGPNYVAKLDRLLTDDRSIMFLRSKEGDARTHGGSVATQASNRGYYRLVSDQSVLVEVDGVARAPRGEEMVPFKAWDGRPFGAVVAHVSEVSS